MFKAVLFVKVPKWKQKYPSVFEKYSAIKGNELDIYTSMDGF